MMLIEIIAAVVWCIVGVLMAVFALVQTIFMLKDRKRLNRSREELEKTIHALDFELKPDVFCKSEGVKE